MMADDILDIINYSNRGPYPRRLILVIATEEYVYLVPYVESESEIFLKTIIPSRKAKTLSG